MNTRYGQPVDGYHATRNGARGIARGYCGTPASQPGRYYPGVDKAAVRPPPWPAAINEEGQYGTANHPQRLSRSCTGFNLPR